MPTSSSPEEERFHTVGSDLFWSHEQLHPTAILPELLTFLIISFFTITNFFSILQMMFRHMNLGLFPNI